MLEASFNISRKIWRFIIDEVMPLGVSVEIFQHIPYVIMIDNIKENTVYHSSKEINPHGALIAIDMADKFIRNNRKFTNANLLDLVNVSSETHKKWHIIYYCYMNESDDIWYIGVLTNIEDNSVEIIKSGYENDFFSKS